MSAIMFPDKFSKDGLSALSNLEGSKIESNQRTTLKDAGNIQLPRVDDKWRKTGLIRPHQNFHSPICKDPFADRTALANASKWPWPSRGTPGMATRLQSLAASTCGWARGCGVMVIETRGRPTLPPRLRTATLACDDSTGECLRRNIREDEVEAAAGPTETWAATRSHKRRTSQRGTKLVPPDVVRAGHAS